MRRCLAVAAALVALLGSGTSLAATAPLNDLGGGRVGVYYPPAKPDDPLVLVIGGSEGGFGGSGATAKALSDEGFGALALAYFKAPGLPDTLQEIPLETFTRGLEFLTTRPETARRRVLLVGVSKGAEAALLVASRDRRVCAVVAGAPSSVAWQGINMADFSARKASWSWAGQPLAYATYDFAGMARGGIRGLYEGGLAKAPPDAVIPVERIQGPILLVSGGKDTLWPSTPMGEAIIARLDAAKFRPQHLHIVYPEAGHGAFGRPWADDKLPPAAAFASTGGTPEANQAARRDVWPKTLAFLREAGAAKGCRASGP